MPSSTESVKFDNCDMELYVSLPDGTGPFAAAVVIQHAGGVDVFTRAMADRLAAAGYAAAAPDLYHRRRSAADFDDKKSLMQYLKDANPSLDDMNILDAELTRCGKAHEFYTYPNAGHAFMDFPRDERYREEASELSWPRTLDFFARHLRV